MLRLLSQRLLDSAVERVETRFEVAGNVSAESTPAALRQNVEIAACLRLLDDAKGIGLAGNRQILGIVAGDLQKNAAVRPAFISLPRRVLKARPEADACRRLGTVADRAPEPLHRIDMGRAALDIGEQRRIVARAYPPEMGLQRRREARRPRLYLGFVARICI